MPEFFTVDVQSIQSEVSRSNFNESEIERLADTILANDGLLQPLILKQTGVESLVVLEGHFEFYSAVRAREKNPRQGEMVNAFVLSPAESENPALREQIQLLRKPVPDLTALITDVETRLSKKLEDVLQNQQKIELHLQQIDEKIPPRIDLSSATREAIKLGLDYLNNRQINGLELDTDQLANALDKIDSAPRQSWSETLNEVPALGCGITTGKKLDIFKEVFYTTPPPPLRINLSTATRDEIKSGLDYLNKRPVNPLGLSSAQLTTALDKIDSAAHRQYWSETLKEVPALRCGITKGKKLDIFKEVFYSTPAPIPPDTTDPILLNTFSTPELKKLAQERGKTGAGRMTKKDWINLLSQP